MSRSFFSWRDWCESGSISVVSGSFESDAPASNLLNETPGILAIADAPGQIIHLSSTFLGHGDDSPWGGPVGLVCLINHNIVDVTDDGDIRFVLYDKDNGSAIYDISSGIIINQRGTFQSHLLFPVPSNDEIDLTQVNRIDLTIQASVLTGSVDQYTGQITEAPFRAGCFRAGPIWRPERGLRFASPQFGITEVRRGVTSIGGQYYPQPQVRQRTLQSEFTLMTEPEVFSAQNPGLQQMAAWCGTSRPLVVVPDDIDNDLVLAQGVYGYLQNDMSWSHFDSTGKPGGKVREYRSSFSIKEAL